MSDQQIEFIRLAGYPIRVSSLKRAEGTGEIHVVTITRGTRDPELLREILGDPVVEIELPGEPTFRVTVTDLDVRSSGDGPAMVSRFGFTLRRSDQTISPDPPTLDERVAALEREVADLRTALSRLTPSQEFRSRTSS